MRFKKIILIAIWGLLIAGVGVLLFMINRHKKNEICQTVKIKIENTLDNHFIDSAYVMEYIGANQIIGTKTENINSGKIETLLENDPHIKNAEVFKDVDGTLFIKIWQRKAIMRVINSEGESYYVDEENFKIPLSENFTARVLVCNGNITEKCTKCDTINSNTLKTCTRIAQYVHNSSFWISAIEQIFVTPEGEILLITKMGDGKIVFGDFENIDDKFERLYTFYKQALPKVGWEKYSTIDVSYKNQIVARKK